MHRDTKLLESFKPLQTFVFQWHRMPTTQETDGFQVKRPGDVNVKCTLLLMIDHQVHLLSYLLACTGRAPRRGDLLHLFPQPLSLFQFFFFPLLPSPLSTNWIRGWLVCWACTLRREPTSCKPFGSTSRTTSCRIVTRRSTSTATAISDR